MTRTKSRPAKAGLVNWAEVSVRMQYDPMDYSTAIMN